ncbi:MAG: ABC transporter ATP-binding protein [Phycisphaerales bacterium]
MSQAITAEPSSAPLRHDQPPVVVRATNLSKRFRIYSKPIHRAREWLRLGRNLHTDFWALRGVSFEVRRGGCLGVIGANGSGKSTLLKIISGAMRPTEGSFEVHGRVLSLIELGTGLNPNLSGRANIAHTAALLGFPPGFARDRTAEIEAFAELGDFFDRPINLYSSGMRVRLAFSMFACFQPELFIVDEALSVGDVFFQQKCAARIRTLLDAGMTMIFVSHDQSAVLSLCDQAIVLDHGRPAFAGDPQQAVSVYLASMNVDRAGHKWSRHPAKPATAALPASPDNASTADSIIAKDILGDRRNHRTGTGALRIRAARVTDESGRDTLRASVGQALRIHVLIEAVEHVDRPRAGIRLFNRLNTLAFGAGTYQLGHSIAPMAPGDRVIVRFDLTLDLEPGAYTFGLGAGEPAGNDPNAGTHHDRIDRLGPIIVDLQRDRPRPFYGLARLPMRATVESIVP